MPNVVNQATPPPPSATIMADGISVPDRYNIVWMRGSHDPTTPSGIVELPLPPLGHTFRPTPPWASFNFNVDEWCRVLWGFGVDDTSLMELFNLAQGHGDVGKLAANHCIAVFLKKMADREPMQSPSAFMHVVVKRERHILEFGKQW